MKSALERALGSAVIANDVEEDATNSDLDDEAMLKLDETIAQAFKLRRGRDKQQQQREIIQYRSRVLDFVQEIFKSPYRLDLTTVRMFSTAYRHIFCPNFLNIQVFDQTDDCVIIRDTDES